jgi:hypothetical protein
MDLSKREPSGAPKIQPASHCLAGSPQTQKKEFHAGALHDKLARMINDNDPEIESSPLCGRVTRDGITVRVEIYRLAGRGESWSLEVIDQEGGSTVWDETFANDEDAYAEFTRTLETDGIRSFSERLSSRTN